MIEQQQNQFITPEEQQRQYLLDLIARKCKGNHRGLAGYYAQEIVERITARIQEGRFEIEKISSRVEELLEERGLSDSARRLISNQKWREQRNRQIKLLYPKNKSLEELQESSYPHNILSLEKHKTFMRQLKMEKTKQEQRAIQMKQREKSHQQRSTSQLQKAEEEHRMAQIERRKEQIQQNLLKMRQNHEKLLMNERETKNLINRIRNKKRLHEYLKQSYEQKIVLPLVEESKRILEQRKENSRLSLEEIENHEKEYLEWKKSQESLERSSVSKSTYQPPPHTKKISRILAEEDQRNKAKVDKQKQLIREKIERVNNYASLLKQRQSTFHTPTVSKTIATTDREKSQKTDMSRRESGKRNNLGNKYLQQARKVLRKRAKTEQGQQPPITEAKPDKPLRQKTMSLNIIEPKKRVQHIQRSKKEEIERMLDCGEFSAEQKLKRIKQADQILSIELKRKEERLKLRFSKADNQQTVDLMLAAVRAKMSLLDCYQGAES